MAKQKEIAIAVKDLHKSFKLPHEQHSGIKQAILNLFKRNRKKGYEIQKVLKGLDFEIEKGDFFGIVGRNGSGKSTLLKTLAGIYSPDKGTIEVNGTLVPFIELGVGFNPELTGRENVFLNGALLGFSHDEMEAMYDDIVEFAELEKFMDQKLKNYSSGMQVRLAFSIAIRADGDILLLDEVLAVGDEAFQRKCVNYFSALKKNNKTVILVTHDMSSVRKFCNKAVLINEGAIVAQGDPNEVADNYSTQFIVNNKTSIKEKRRFGNGEVIFDNMKFEIYGNLFQLEFDIVNKTNHLYNDITMGFDFCINDEIIIGNDTRFMEKYKDGFKLDALQRKHVIMKFRNDFGKHSFTLNANITTGMGINVTDYIRSVLSFDSTNVRHVDAWKILAYPEIIETEDSE